MPGYMHAGMAGIVFPYRHPYSGCARGLLDWSVPTWLIACVRESLLLLQTNGFDGHSQLVKCGVHDSVAYMIVWRTGALPTVGRQQVLIGARGACMQHEVDVAMHPLNLKTGLNALQGA
eukprot:364507-Chlamydomonas_euryale.AAC.9